MRRGHDEPWELWALLFGIIGFIAIPIIVGTVIIKVFRHFKPIKEVENQSLTTLGLEARDGFIKTACIGWIICGPLFYLVFKVYFN